MPITVVCSGCGARLNAPDTAAGKKVKCSKPGCGKILVVPEPIAAEFEVDEDNPPPKPPQKKAASATVEDDPPPKKKRRDEDEEDEDERPKSKRRRDEDDDEDERPRSKRRRDEDEEEEDERPRSKRRRDDDDEDERPRKKNKKKQQSAGLSPALLAGIVIGGLLLVSAVGYGVYALAFKNAETASSGDGSGKGSGSSSKAGVPAGWVEFQPEGGGFKAYFPVKPEVKPKGSGKMYEGEDKSSKVGCMVLVLPAGHIPQDERKEFGEAMIKLILAAGGKQLSRQETTLAGKAATEVTFEALSDKASPSKGPTKGKTGGKSGDQAPMGQAVLRMVIADTQVFLVGVACDVGAPKPEWVSGFFDNFEWVK